jgi:hypothetical protein
MLRLALLPLVFSACHGAAAPDLRLDLAPAPATAADFPAAAAILRGFDAGSATDLDWRAGDQVLFGLRLRTGDRLRHWLLHLQVLEPQAADADGAARAPLPAIDWTLNINGAPEQFHSRLCRVQATVHDQHGVVVGRSEPLVPRDLLANGFAAACELVVRQQRRRPHMVGTDGFYQDLDLAPLARATVCAVALLQVVQDDAVLSPLLWEVVQRPSLWSVLSHLGARVVLRPRFHAAVEVPASAASGAARAWQVPMTLLVNDQPVLLTELLVGEPWPPFALGGSLLGATARHPEDGGREFALQLLAARRGPPVAAR